MPTAAARPESSFLQGGNSGGADLQAYLRLVREQLSDLDPAEVEDILLELESHLRDRAGECGAAAAIAALGAPDALARLYRSASGEGGNHA